ncbi:uncharacterized protein LOC128309229 [Anopheles moucheti]|uniref:uncharacterized protein LOC128309229 n=1 Tax=Anopheles moucheti TaxID=186751 RepID=UPI0022F0B7D1|nr:uncharacterized protein LOC128309229 [Anopheles moucheti]
MTSPAEMLKLASAVVPRYDGNESEADNIIAALTALKTTVNEQNAQTAICIIVSKLSKKAKTVVGSEPTSIDDIIKIIKEKCKRKSTPETLTATLNATKQQGSAEDFANEIQNLAKQLEKAYIADQTAPAKALQKANKAGITAFANGLKKEQHQTIVMSEQWPLFISSYEHSTAICGYSDYENLLRLQKALKGAALEAVSSLLLLPSGLKEATDVLKLRFGRPEVIVENLMEKVRRLPAPRADRLDTLVESGFAVRNLCATIQASGLPEYTCNVILLKELIVKLPSATCIEWARHQQQLPSVTLSDFGRWIGELAAALSRVVPVKSERFERSGSGDSDRRSSVKPVRPDQRQPTTARLNMHAATTSSRYPHTNVSKCSACQGECAALDTCQRFQTMTVAERKEHIRDKKLCRKCLKYHKGWCHLKTVCGSNGCEAMHHRLLHGSLGMTNTTEKHCLTHSGSNDRTLFRYVPVTMYGKDGRTVRTYAFLDEGSSSTFIDHSLMDELGLIGTSRPLCLK